MSSMAQSIADDDTAIETLTNTLDHLDSSKARYHVREALQLELAARDAER